MKKIVIIEKDCDLKIRACNRMNFSSNINEVIRAVLNSFFYEKISHAPKIPKAPKGTKTPKQKHKTTNKRISDFFPLRCFLRAFFIFVRCKRFVLFVLVKFLNKEV